MIRDAAARIAEDDSNTVSPATIPCVGQFDTNPDTSSAPYGIQCVTQQVCEYLPQFARLIHFHHDVRAPDQLPIDVKLRNRRPIAKDLDAVTNF